MQFVCTRFSFFQKYRCGRRLLRLVRRQSERARKMATMLRVVARPLLAGSAAWSAVRGSLVCMPCVAESFSETRAQKQFFSSGKVIPVTNSQGAAFPKDLRSTSGLGKGDDLDTHTSKWLSVSARSPPRSRAVCSLPSPRVQRRKLTFSLTHSLSLSVWSRSNKTKSQEGEGPMELINKVPPMAVQEKIVACRGGESRFVSGSEVSPRFCPFDLVSPQSSIPHETDDPPHHSLSLSLPSLVRARVNQAATPLWVTPLSSSRSTAPRWTTPPCASTAASDTVMMAPTRGLPPGSPVSDQSDLVFSGRGRGDGRRGRWAR